MPCTILNKNIEVKFVKQIKNIIMSFQFEKELIIAPFWLPQSTKPLIPIKGQRGEGGAESWGTCQEGILHMGQNNLNY